MVAALRTLIKLELEIGLCFGVERGTLHATDAAGELFPELPPFIWLTSTLTSKITWQKSKLAHKYECFYLYK